MGNFQELDVWKRAKNLSVDIYRLTLSPAFEKDYGLKDQIRRAAVSVPSNIAEGDERETNKEAVRFFYIANGSLAEVKTQLIIAYELSYLEADLYTKRLEECHTLSKMLKQLIKHRKLHV
ncbi:four helix bundle protein [Sulfurimonas sp. HSL-3221]|uniref:four helix bundle protein n=1 Tax=Sulfurimonadaceae TaxID=2771471 RepID=UPI001E33FF3C|nr:four helix bundle protein [Sulfurimonas sp. HSL-3221]UFS62273.1 four helix bundle protein [Sulfurimonas sp. HSL-3221]